MPDEYTRYNYMYHHWHEYEPHEISPPKKKDHKGKIVTDPYDDYHGSAWIDWFIVILAILIFAVICRTIPGA